MRCRSRTKALSMCVQDASASTGDHVLAKTHRTGNPAAAIVATATTPIQFAHQPTTQTDSTQSPTQSERVPTPLPPGVPTPLPRLILPQPLRLPMTLIQRLLATINMIWTIVARAILAIVAAARAVSVGAVSVGGVRMVVIRRRRRRKAAGF
jgi:hypothetical protein